MLNPLSILHSGEPSWLLEPFSWIKKLSKWNPVKILPTDCAEGSQTWGHLVVWLWIIRVDPTAVSVDNLFFHLNTVIHLDLLLRCLEKKTQMIFPQNGGEMLGEIYSCWGSPTFGVSQDPYVGMLGVGAWGNSRSSALSATSKRAHASHSSSWGWFFPKERFPGDDFCQTSLLQKEKGGDNWW